METLIVFLGFMGVFAIVLAVSAILNGFVLSMLWAWFVVPVFNLPEISIPIAIGIALIANMLTFRGANESKDDRSFWVEFAGVFLVPIFILFVGWIVHLFV